MVWVILCPEVCSICQGCLLAPLASSHQVPRAAPLIVTTKHVWRLCPVSLGWARGWGYCENVPLSWGPQSTWVRKVYEEVQDPAVCTSAFYVVSTFQMCVHVCPWSCDFFFFKSTSSAQSSNLHLYVFLLIIVLPVSHAMFVWSSSPHSSLSLKDTHPHINIPCGPQ